MSSCFPASSGLQGKVRKLLVKSRSLSRSFRFVDRCGADLLCSQPRERQQRQECVRVVRMDTLQVLYFWEQLTVAELLQELSVPHHYVCEPQSQGAASMSGMLSESCSSEAESSGSSDVASSAALSRSSTCLHKGPMLPSDALLYTGCVYFLSPLPTLLQKAPGLSTSPTFAPGSDSDHSCCCGAGTAQQLLPPRPHLATSLLEGLSPSRSAAVSVSGSGSGSRRKSGSYALDNIRSSSFDRREQANPDMADLALQVAILSELLSGAEAASPQPDLSCKRTARGIDNGRYCPSQCMRSRWKPELIKICEASACTRPLVHTAFSFDSFNSRERSREDQPAAAAALPSDSPLYVGTKASACSIALLQDSSLTSCRTVSSTFASRSRVSWASVIGGLSGFGGLDLAPPSWGV